ncbi:DNA recombination protein RmuC [Candidatus Magnetominusculus dajiuhuensis]|uniref:DNA recombination protein RmuC n=1 Tax=Candidatus Magnetominusculus dajiuhuensis TaxID=3137712 RepID=UPI003B434B10
MGNIVTLIAGLSVGALVGWLVVSRRLLNEHYLKCSALEGNLKAAEAQLNALKVQLIDKANEVISLREDLSDARQSHAVLQTKLVASDENLRAQRGIIENAKKDLTDTFTALSAVALKSTSEDFIRLANESLEKILSETKGSLGLHQEKIHGLVSPLTETLKKYEEQIQKLESKWDRDHGSLATHIQNIVLSNQQLQKETSNLATALKNPQIRGRWGEIQLTRTVELAGMAQHCDFNLQTSVDTDTGRLRPDMIIHLPSNRDIVVDSKVSLIAYVEAVSSDTPDDNRAILFKKHARHVRDHMERLAQKAYWEQFKKSPEFVVLFLPGESFFSAALEYDIALLEDAASKRIIIATPFTLIALLRAIAFGWRQEQMTKNAELISKAAKELYERSNVFIRYLAELGKGIKKSVDGYNSVVASLDKRLLPTLRKFKELGVAASDETVPLDVITHEPARLFSDDEGMT